MNVSRRPKLRRVLASTVLALTLVASFALPAAASNIGTEGCTPGYWKNHTDNWEEYLPSWTIGSVFTSAPAPYASLTLLQGLQLRGGPGAAGATEILLRASVAAFLNAAHEGIGYPYRRFDDPGQLEDTINAALASGDRSTMIALAAWLDAANNLGCPLS